MACTAGNRGLLRKEMKSFQEKLSTSHFQSMKARCAFPGVL